MNGLAKFAQQESPLKPDLNLHAFVRFNSVLKSVSGDPVFCPPSAELRIQKQQGIENLYKKTEITMGPRRRRRMKQKTSTKNVSEWEEEGQGMNTMQLFECLYLVRLTGF